MRILIVKFGAIGDVIMAIPAAHGLHLAGYQVDWVCGPAVLPVLALYPWISPVVADERKLLTGTRRARLQAVWAVWRKLIDRRYDLIATLYYDRRYSLLALPLRGRRKLRLSHRERGLRLLPGRAHTDEYARILQGLPDEHRPMQLAPVQVGNLPASPAPRTPATRVVLAPAGARNLLADDALRRWPVEHYVALAGLLLAQGLEVVLIGGPDDAWAQAAFAGLPVLDLIGRLKLPETLALLDEADLLVTHDTGPLHLAGITRCGILALFGPVDPHGRLPHRPGARAIWGGEGFACRPCYDGRSYAPCPRNDCLRQVAPALVLGEAQAMLAARARGEPGGPSIVSPAIAASNLIAFPGGPAARTP